MREIGQWRELAPQQRRSWIRAADRALDPSVVRVALHGPLDHARVHAALVRLCQAHDQLGVRLDSIAGVRIPVQRVVEPRLGWAMIDCVDGEERELRWRSFRAEVALADGPTLRARWVRTAGASVELWLGAAPLLLDAESMIVLLDGLAAELEGRAAELDASASFEQVASWQLALLEDDEHVEQRGRDAIALREGLEQDRVQVSACTLFEPGAALTRRPLRLPERVRAAVVEAGDDDPLRAEALLLCAWRLTLARRAGLARLSVVRVSSGRVLAELERCVGLLGYATMTTASFAESTSFASAWADAELDVEDEPLPLLCLREHDEVSPSLGFRFMRVPRFVALGGCEAELLELDDHADVFGLALECRWRADEGPELTLICDPTRIDERCAGLLGDGLAEVLELGLGDRGRSFAEFPRVSASERAALQVAARGEPPSPSSGFVHERFEWHALARPDALALEDEHGQLSYAALRGRVNAWAWMLRSRGVGPDSIVGLYLERSAVALVAQLAVLAAGGAFMALDERAPPARIAELVERVDPIVLLGERSLRASWPGPRELLCLDEPPWSTARARARPPQVRLHPANAAYVLHTSGSTGTPRPVVVEHRSLVAYVDAVTRRLELPEHPRCVLVSTFAADLGNTVIWPALTRGGWIYVPSWTRVLDPEPLAELLGPRGIEVGKIVPSHLDALFASGRAELLPRTHLVVGGEAARAGLLSAVAAAAPGLRIFNHYGPTETTVGAIAGALGPAELDASPLGRPLAGMFTPVVDERGQPCPIGCAGELLLGGRQVARGYLGHPRASAARFVPDESEPGARMYRSGDRARVNPDGTISFLGRFDAQLKIRGHRVEPAELAETLRRLPEVGIRDAVIGRVDDASGPRLVAYLVPALELHGPRLRELARAQVEAWQTVFNTTHGSLEPRPGVTFNAFGWDSSYTGEQMPDDHIREQVEQTVARVRELGPERVLEIGCGTGLLLFELAGGCQRYVGTDLAQDVLRYTAQVLRSIPELEARVELRELGTDELDALGEQRFDTIIINSVIQYFPSVEYLVEVLARLREQLAPGGRIFVGDVRDLRLLDAFHVGVELFRASPSTTAAVLRQRVAQQRSRERELLIEPEFWRRLGDWLPGLAGVEVHLKRGRWHNELTRARYDVIIHAEPGLAPPPTLPRHEFCDEAPTLEALAERIDAARAERAPGLIFAGLRNARLSPDLCVLALLDADSDGAELDATTLRSRAAAAAADAIDPELLARVAEASGFAVNLRWGTAADRFDAVLLARGRAGLVPEPAVHAGGPAGAYANAPLLDELAGELVPRVRRALAERVPDYMIPDAFVLVERLPLTPNGKLDHARLRKPTFAAREHGVVFVAPRTPLEARIAAVWREVLQLDEVGVHDNFFDLGGHSLLATQVVVRIRASLASSLPLSSFFDGEPTIARLARILECGDADEDRGPQLRAIAAAELGVDAGPLAHTQVRMLFDPDPSHPFHNIPFAFYLEGELDRAALLRALDLILERHAAWRSVFERGPTPGESRQRVVDLAEVGGFPLTCVDLRAHPQAHVEARRIAEREGQRRFVLDAELPIRGSLLQLDERLHVLVLVAHHLVSDGWSTGVFCAELSHAYARLRRGEPPELPELPVQYRDYASWQARWLSGRRLETQLGYWIEQLSHRTLELALPTDFPRPAQQTWRGDGISVALPAALAQAAASLASRHDASLFITLLAVYVAELHLLSGQTDLGVGTPVANRTQVELERLLGCFINLLVIQTDLDGDPSFAELLARVRAQCVRAYSHQDAPFHTLIEALAIPEPGRARPPLFQVMFELANVPGDRRLRLDGLELRGLDFAHGTSEFEFNLILQQDGDTLAGWLLYRTELYTERSARALFDGFARLLAAVIEDDRRPLSSYRDALPRSWPCG